MSGRSRTETTEAILRVVAAGEWRKARMTYGGYLSYRQLEECADFMIQKGVVFMEERSGLYKLTPEGEALLNRPELAAGQPRLSRELSGADPGLAC